MRNLLILLLVINTAADERPRGVSPQFAGFYHKRADGKFRCLDGSDVINFDRVNDDYCDCKDSSDEPGTSACPNASFMCTNIGFVPTPILSSRVNDMVCDCCDGSDEYNSGKSCKNTCSQEREKQMERFKSMNEGFEMRKVQISVNLKAIEETKKKLSDVETNLGKEKTKREELERKKSEKELPEKEAKDKHRAAYEAEKDANRAAVDKEKFSLAFDDLDSDQSGGVELEELVHCASIDGSNKCGVTEAEIKEWFPIDKTSLTKEEFEESIWEKLKQFYIEETEVGPQPLEEEEADGQYDEEDDELEDDDYPDSIEEVPAKPIRKLSRARGNLKSDEMPDDMPPYDEHTLKLIDDANEARRLFDEQDKIVKDMEKELNELNDYLNLDSGPEHEFLHLKEKCFDIDEKEYTYSFCPFNKGSQKPKKGGGETNLGRWGEWSGKDNKYSQMKLTKGQRCWNGPDRSLTVNMFCGSEERITSTSEPSMCEYVMDFTTPALCDKFYDLLGGAHGHMEL